MNKALRRFLFAAFSIIAIAFGPKASASHFYGADFYYTWVSGNTYTVTLAVYGDCSGSSFPMLQGATPQVQIYNGTSLFNTINLVQQGNGVEVTPVCPAQQGQTVCSNPNSTIPGVTRYIYSGNVTLNTTSTAWKFHFNGSMGASATAGRSNSITNIVSGTVTAFDALLNNVPGPNSSPTYTTIPTPFFCINKAANYNPGAVDPNGDALTFSLVPGLTSTGGTVTYVAPATAVAPLATTLGTYSFTSTTGQISFTPNASQRSLVTSQVTEIRNGVQVGTSMREMTFVVLSTCNNNPPGGSVSNPSTGITVLSPIVINVCKSVGYITFNINPTDLDGDNINVVANGLPAGAVFLISGNNTTTPSGAFGWNISGVAPGSYNFFITYTDDGCPLSSKQTQAYTINVLPNPSLNFTLVSAATCTKKAVFTFTPAGASAPYGVTFAGTHIYTGLAAGSVNTDSLAPGIYTFSITSGNTCTKDTVITIASPVLPILNYVPISPTCVGGTNGTVTLNPSNGTAPYTYAFNGAGYSSANIYTGLAAGGYPVFVKDAGNCVLATSVVITDPPPILSQVTFTKPPCNFFANGSLTIAAYNSTGPYQYALGSGAYQPTGTFTGLYSGPYLIHIQNALGCVKDTTIILPDSVKIVATSIPITNVTCFNTCNATATINASGANGPPYTYSIGSGAFGTANTFTALCAGGYTLHVHDIEGCYLDTVINITQPTVVVAVPNVTQNVSCNGGANGTVTIGGSGGTPGYTYSVDAGAYGASPTITGLTAGSHTANVKDANGCIQSATFTITQPPPIIVGWTSVQPQCSYSSDGSITVSGSGGNGGAFTYAIDATGYQSSGLFAGLAGGTHTLHVKDVNGCVKDSIVTLLTPPAIIPSASVTKSTCGTLANGKVILSATGGTPGYTYANGAGTYQVSGTFTPLAANTYTFHVKDTHGCIKDTIIVIADSLTISGNVTITNAACYAQSSGAINVVGTGGVAAYTYALGTGTYGGSGTFGTLAAGPYVLHIKDVNGCIKDTNLTITQPTRLIPAVTITNVLCNGAATGAINISTTGGTPGYAFANGANPYQLSGAFTGLTAGPYTIHTKDTNGCIIDTALTITQPAKLAFTLVVTNVLCNGGSTGTVTVNATGGVTPYQYAYDAGAFGASNALTGFNAGSHTIHLKDANGCTKDTTINITQPAVLKLGYTAVQPSCNGGNNGVITITGVGGTTPYSFAVNTGAFQASGIINGITAGTYVLHIKDANGCTFDSTGIIVGEPTPVTVAVTNITRPRCTPLVNGAISIVGGGGTPGYTYANGTGAYQASGTFGSIPSGTYTLHVKDTKGCIKDTTIILADSIFVHANLVITNATCYDTSNGQIAITAFGGFTPYTYRLVPNAFASTNPIINIHAGTYTLTVKDGVGCTLDTAVTIAQPTVVAPSVTITQPLCYGQSNGSILAGAVGGTPGYTYAISTGTYGTTTTFGGLPAGVDTIHVKDINGCRHDTIVTIGQPTPLLYANIALSNVKCFGDNSGYVTVTATGATPPYAYSADAVAFQTSNVVTGLNAGAHVIHLQDANGCTKDSTISLTQPPLLVLDSIRFITPTCEGYPDGTITIRGNGGTRPYLFSTDGVNYDTVRTFAHLVEGQYHYWITDSQQCVHDTIVNLVGYPHIVIGGAALTQPTCYGFHNGAIQLNVTGGNPILTYQLVNPVRFNATGAFDSLTANTYKILIKDSTGCHKDTTVVLTQPDSLHVSALVTPNDCVGADNSGGARSTVTGGVTPYGYLWNTAPAQTTPDLVGTANGTFRLLVTDANGCKDSLSAKVTYDDCCKPFMPDAFTPNGDGKNDLFRLRFKGDVLKLQFSVYNRFGQRVFFTENVRDHESDGWDGTYGGQPADLGVYMYYVKFYCGNKEDNLVEYKGDVTLIR